ncbi:hypothetical protein D3C78_1901110 [compost metagenome]
MCGDVLPFNGPTEYAADGAHLAVDGRRLVTRLHPSGADLLKVAACDRVEALSHDRVKVVVQGV